VSILLILSYFTEGDENEIQKVLDLGVLSKIISLLELSTYLKYCLRIIGNITNGNDNQMNQLLNFPLITMLFEKIQSATPTVKQNILWILSNIAAGTLAQKEQIIIHKELIKVVVQCCSTDSEKVKKEAGYILSNLAFQSNEIIISTLSQLGTLEALISLLLEQNPIIIIVALEGIKHFLSVSNNDNNYVDKVESLGGLDKIEALQSHPNVKVYEASLEILETYYEGEEEEEWEDRN